MFKRTPSTSQFFPLLTKSLNPLVSLNHAPKSIKPGYSLLAASISTPYPPVLNHLNIAPISLIATVNTLPTTQKVVGISTPITSLNVLHASSKFSSSPAIPTHLPLNRSGSNNAFAAKTPISPAATTWILFSPTCFHIAANPFPAKSGVKFSMNVTGLKIVHPIPVPPVFSFRYCSI